MKTKSTLTDEEITYCESIGGGRVTADRACFEERERIIKMINNHPESGINAEYLANLIYGFEK